MIEMNGCLAVVFCSPLPVQQTFPWGLGRLTGLLAAPALGAGKHVAFVFARVEPHGAGVVTGLGAGSALLASASIKAHYQGAIIGHPGEALEESDGAAKTTKKVACEQKLHTKCQRGDAYKYGLIAGEFAV